MVSVRLPLEIEEMLDQLAKKTGRTKAFHARRAILDHLEDLEDAEIAERALDEFYKSGEKAISIEEVMKSFDD